MENHKIEIFLAAALAVSEIIALIPAMKANGFLHGLIVVLKGLKK
jgi:hypothetical protein